MKGRWGTVGGGVGLRGDPAESRLFPCLPLLTVSRLGMRREGR